MRTILWLALLCFLAFGGSGCATRKVMKDCIPLSESSELEGLYACKHQWKIWN